MVQNRNINENTFLVIPPKKLPPFTNWSSLNNMNLKDLAKLGLNASTLNTFLFILAELDFDNVILFNQARCAKEMNMSASTVCKAVKTLEKNNLIQRLDNKEGSFIRFRINPIYIFKGKSASFQDCVDAYFEVA